MISQDITLQKSDIQSLSSQEALLAFFTRLGYSTENHLPQTPAAMGFTAEALVHEIRSIERIADEEGELQVYLIELKHLTVAITQALARALRNRAGSFLLVLTVDYERLDFVLLEAVLPERERSGITAPQVYLRPRVLTVNRRNPNSVDLRVLRRFSFTEIDPLYQWDKLRSAYSVAEWSEPFFNNRALFSDYYLNERLPGLPEWQEDIRPAYQELQTLYSDVRQRHARQPEADLRRDLFEPVFQRLGWRWKVEKPPEDDSAQADYSLITPDGDKIPCLTYTWDRFLDGPDEARDPATPRENPGQTAVGVLDSLDGDGWVVMTNGKLWRLYSARAHSRATNYYEIDLEETLASPDPGQAFRYFWLFFRAAAFELTPPHPQPLREALTPSPSPEGRGEKSFLDRLLDESASYAKALGERLKNRVFEQVFPHFAAGFIHHWRKSTGKTAFSDDELAQVFQGTLTFLYRLLFLLYAEARDLLPAREVRDYYDASLQRMKEEIAQKAGAVLEEAEAKLEKAYPADSTALYDALSRLFRSVDRGDPALNVPTYNGGLFITFDGEPPAPTEDDSPELHNAVFLARHKIPDRFLALGLDRLARDVDEKTFALAMIDYKSLGVRQLGSIYEGLLEFKVRIAAEKMAIVSGKKGEEIVPYAQAVKQGLKIKASGRGSARKEQIIPKGAVYLTNDRRERKATGSYYTPDYIVKYIVQHTVGPALEAKCEAARPLIREAQQAYRKAVERQKAFQKQGMAGDDPEKVAYSYRHVVDALFDLRVLDPAMGSGHFLVEAVDFITDRLLTFLSAFPWNPVTAALRQTRQTILEEMQRQGVNVDPARLTDVHLLKRHVLKRCIYGVDLNPMAVELAKVSLWLDCFTLGAPLSFLDHHLKCGNSLIGARIEEVRAALDMAAEKDRLEIPLLAGMMGSQFAGVMLATDLMRRVGELSDVTASQVRESRDEYRRASDALAPYRRILDIYTSRWFGNPDARLSSPVLDFLRNPKTEAWLKNPSDRNIKLKPDEQKLVDIAIEAAREKRFFHWELEFPEVFFGSYQTSKQLIVEKQNPGFDVVIGNPPYVLTSAKDDTLAFEKQVQERRALEQSGDFETLWGRWDVFVPFVEKAVKILKNQGYHSFIISNSIEIAPYASKLRNMILNNYHLCELHYFSGFQVFEGVGVNPTVYILRKTSPNFEQTVYRFHHRNTNLTKTAPELVMQNVGEEIWNSSFTLTLTNTYMATLLLGEICYICAGAQLQSDQEKYRDDFTKDDLISSSPSEIHTHLYSEGKDLNRYDITELKFVAYDTNIQRMKRPRFRELFENPKLMISLSGFATAQINQNEPFDGWVYCNHSIILALRWIQLKGIYNRSIDKSLPSKNRKTIRDRYEKISNDYNILYLLALINSKYLNSYTRSQLTRHKIFITEEAWRKTPIRLINFSTPSTRRKSLFNQLHLFWETDNSSELLASVNECLSTQPEESDVIHDLLAFLAQQMIEMNNQKQVEMKRFLGWLEGVLHIQPGKDGSTGLDVLTGKSRLRSYLGDYQKGEVELSFDELQDILFKNRNRLGVSLNDPRFTARLREEYEKSLAVLLPIKEKLRWTDNLIDQIVYRLYGLTEEEIAVVEGRK